MSPRRLQWGLPEEPRPKHPYRDTLIVYAALAAIVVLFAWVSGGSVRKAIPVALLVFVGASAWSIVRWRQRLRQELRKRADAGREP
jgi:hypothetical protein